MQRESPATRRLGAWFSTLLAAALLAGCATNAALEEGRSLLADGKQGEALERMRAGLVGHGEDKDLRREYFRLRDRLVNQQLAAAEAARGEGRLDAAEAAWRKALEFEPTNARAREGLADVVALRRQQQEVEEARQLLDKGDGVKADALLRRVLAERPDYAPARALMEKLQEKVIAQSPQAATQLKSPFSKPITLEFRDTPLKSVFEVISRTAGVNFVFDKDVRADAKVTIFMRNGSIDDVIKLILSTQQLASKMINDNSVLIYPNTGAKQKEYQELVTRTFLLSNADAKQVANMVKQVVKTRDIYVDEKLNLLVMKDTDEAVRLAEQLIASMDVPEPEVVLEVEVLEVSRNKLLDLGLQFPEQVGYGALQNSLTQSVIGPGGTVTTQTVPGGQLAAGNIDLRNRSGLTSYIANPALLLNLKDQDGDVNLLANPRIRVKSREKAKIHIGDKLPVFTTTSTANVGVSASVNYLDVGLKLEVEPIVHLDEEVAIKVGLEVSSIVKEVPGPSNSLAYQIGTREANTVLRLRDGETQVLAGLISDEERSSASRLPGLGDLPIVGRLFSTERDSHNKSEIVLLITPHVVRNLQRPALASAALPAGTEADVGAPPLWLKPTAPGSLGVASGASGGASRVAPIAPAPGAREKDGDAERPATPTLAVAAPVSTTAGSELPVTVRVSSPRPIKGGEVTLHFDSTQLEPVSPPASGDLLTLTVPAGQGTLAAEARFRVRDKAAGTLQLDVTDAHLTMHDGEVLDLPDAGAAVNILPAGK